MKPINKIIILLAVIITGSIVTQAQQQLASDKPFSAMFSKQLQEKIANNQHRAPADNRQAADKLPSARPIPRPSLPAGIHFVPVARNNHLSNQEKIKQLPGNKPVSIQEFINKRTRYRSLQAQQ